MSELNPWEKSDIADEVSGSALGMEDAMARYDLEVDEIEEVMLDEGYEQCTECGWWDEAGALIEDDINGYKHPDC